MRKRKNEKRIQRTKKQNSGPSIGLLFFMINIKELFRLKEGGPSG
jgi:hypothetical protein